MQERDERDRHRYACSLAAPDIENVHARPLGQPLATADALGSKRHGAQLRWAAGPAAGEEGGVISATLPLTYAPVKEPAAEVNRASLPCVRRGERHRRDRTH